MVSDFFGDSKALWRASVTETDGGGECRFAKGRESGLAHQNDDVLFKGG